MTVFLSNKYTCHKAVLFNIGNTSQQLISVVFACLCIYV